MRRPVVGRAALGFLTLILGAGALSCRPDPTGIIVAVDLGQLQLDELRFEVSVAGAAGVDGEKSERVLLVDPENNGRVLGPFFGAGSEETQPIVLDDSLDGRGVSCVVTGIFGGMPVAYGRNNVRVVAHYFTRVPVPMAGAPIRIQVQDASSDADRDAGAADDGGDTGGSGGTTPVPMSGSGGAGGSGGMTPVPMTGTGGSGSGGGAGAGGSGGGAAPDAGSAGTGGANRDAGAPGTGGSGGSPPPPPPPRDAGAVDRPPPLKENGTRCVGAAECQSRHCVDGVCCGDACPGACRTCNAAGRAGACVNVGAGTRDPRGGCPDRGGSSCDTNGTCNGNGGCGLYPAGTACIPASCQNKNFLLPASTCNGAGDCLDQPRIKCDKDLMCVTGACR